MRVLFAFPNFQALSGTMVNNYTCYRLSENFGIENSGLEILYASARQTLMCDDSRGHFGK